MAKFGAFQPNATGHTWANAYLLSLASLYIYENQGMKYAPLRQKTQRWVNEGDPVPLLPCDNYLPPCTYRHVGVTNNIYAGGAIHPNDNERHYAPDATTAAHSVARYCMLIHNKLPTDLRRQFRDPLG